MNKTSDEFMIHSYIDGRLGPAECKAFEATLARDPELAARVARWRQDARQVRAAFAGEPALPPNTALDPAAIRRRTSQARRTRWAIAASLVLSLGLGGLGGWHVREATSLAGAPPMEDALQAYRMWVINANVQADVVQRRPGELQGWLQSHFADSAHLPDLSHAGFQAVSARMMSTEQGPAAMVLYRDERGRSISFYIRPPGPANHLLPHGQREERGLTARYWSQGSYNYAWVSHTDSDVDRAIESAIDG